MVYQKIKQKVIEYVYQYTPGIYRQVISRKVGIKYIISGGIAAVVQLSLLYILTEVFGWWYIYSVSIAYGIAMMVAFLLHKFWTFRDNRLNYLAPQFVVFGIISTINFFINPLLVGGLVEWLHIWYIIAQIIVMILLAIESFFLNKSLTFRRSVSGE